jgi:RNA polymerase sigma factor (sigma-70 family)
MDYLEALDKHRKEWIKYVRKMGANPLDIEDIIQDSYLRVYQGGYGDRVLKDNGTVNKTYFWCILHTMFIANVKAKKKANNVDFGDVEGVLKADEHHELKEAATNVVLDKMHSEITKLDKRGKYPFNQELFTLYVYENKSMRGIRDEVGISLSSVFTTLKNCKAQLSEELKEDFEDLLNEDYELILQNDEKARR